MRSKVFAVGLLVLSTLSAYSQVSPPTQLEGRVIGTVLDEQGQPINNAQVSTQVSLPGKTVVQYQAQTDEAGQFEMAHLAMGTFAVIASKNEDGYADYDQLVEFPTVTLTPEAPIATVVIKLGPRDAILVPSVKDKVTGKPVCNFLVTWHAVPTGTSGISGGAGFSRWTTHTSIPAEKDILIDEVSARGYKKWVYTDQSNPSRQLQLHLQRGEYKSLSIELQPEGKDAPTPH